MESWLIPLGFIFILGVPVVGSVLGKRYGVEYMIAILATTIVLADLLASKVISVGGYFITAAEILVGSTFLFTDILSEFWGKEVSKRAVTVGLFCKLVVLVSVWVTTSLPPAPGMEERSLALSTALGGLPRIVLASIAAYAVSQYHDIWAFHFWKKLTNGKHLWLRNNASTMVSQAFDSAIFVTLAFYGEFPIGNMILGIWLVKVAIAAADTPFIYLTRWILSRTKEKERDLLVVQQAA